jgi:23S rRNA (uracil1939-C5)-methyltransferase
MKLRLKIDDASSDGRAVGRHEGRVVFVEHAVPGDVVDVRVFKKEKKRWLAAIETVVEPSPVRTRPLCEHFGECGGCAWQHIRYSSQVEFKTKQVHDALTRIGGFDPQTLPPFLPTLTAEETYYYRNKLDFAFSDRRWIPRSEIKSALPDNRSRPALGFHVSGAFDKILDLNACHLQNPLVNDVRNELRDYCIRAGYTFYDVKTHNGFLRNVVFRTAGSSMMIVLVTSLPPSVSFPVSSTADFDSFPVEIDDIFSHLFQKFDFVTSWVWIYNPKRNDAYAELPYKIWAGEEYLLERMGDKTFEIGPTSFFQTNPRQAERLYREVYDALAGKKYALLYDLYCGAGTIGLYCSDLAEKIVGIEYSEKAVEDARRNALRNGRPDAVFFAGDIAKVLNADFIARHGRPDALICDPPRAGMDSGVVQQIPAFAPPVVVYVSCNPATQARDLALMAERYRIVRIRPVDLFPQTPHVENVVVLERKDG